MEQSTDLAKADHIVRAFTQRHNRLNGGGVAEDRGAGTHLLG